MEEQEKGETWVFLPPICVPRAASDNGRVLSAAPVLPDEPSLLPAPTNWPLENLSPPSAPWIRSLLTAN